MSQMTYAQAVASATECFKAVERLNALSASTVEFRNSISSRMVALTKLGEGYLELAKELRLGR